MTKEDIKQICQIYDSFRSERNTATIAYNSEDAFYEHILATCKLSQPSLPDNLDEAAEETAKKYYCSCLEKHNETGICDGCENIKQSFKAGAEWMTGQGYKQTERVYNFNGENIPCVSPVIYLPKEFEIGDKVIVHVRKK